MTIDREFFRQNRRRLGAKLGSGLVVLAAYDNMQASADQAHEFDFEANFYYLTGIQESRYRLIYDVAKDYSYLVRPRISEVERIFDGSMSDQELRQRSGVDEIIDRRQARSILIAYARDIDVVSTLASPRYGGTIVVNPAIGNLRRELRRIFRSVIDISHELAKLRAIKQPLEIAAIKQAIAVSSDAFRYCYEHFDSYDYEYQIEADFTANFRRHNARHAYLPIVANGHNAVTLHYIHNDALLADRSLTLLDIGARVDGYCSDITRVFAHGDPTDRQRAVFDAVSQAQAAIIALLEPGLTIKEYQHRVDDIIFEALQSLGLASTDRIATVRRYMPHAVSHGLGIDTHDRLGGVDRLESGMVITVEPGIYIDSESIGVRLEDDILITDHGYENLSGELATAL